MRTTSFHITIGTVMLLGMLTTGCTENRLTDITKTPETAGQTAEPTAVERLLQQVPGVSGIEMQVSDDARDTVYYFQFRQAVDHQNPVAGTFMQHCSLRFRAGGAPVVLHTQGYGMADSIRHLREPELGEYLKANTLEVEHRYFNKSLPEAPDNIDFNYLWTVQAAADLHAVVQAFRQTVFPNNKWVATGISKGGISTTLYAFYSTQYGWNDIDLYVPFCAPFLTGSQASCADTSVHEYTVNSCGSGYPAGSAEAVAYQRLRAIPQAIADNEKFRKACIDHLKLSTQLLCVDVMDQMNAGDERLLPTLEQNLTATVVSEFVTRLADKFVKMPFSVWAHAVPDPAVFTAADATRDDISSAVSFIFYSGYELGEALAQQQSTKAAARRAPINPVDLLKSYRDEEQDAPFNVQGSRELGLIRAACPTLQPGSFVTSEQVTSVASVVDDPEKYETYFRQWDGGRLMTSVRQWVHSQTAVPIIFVYNTDDPWTGGAIDDPSPDSKTRKVLNPGGCHSDDFLNLSIYTLAANSAIMDYIRQAIGYKAAD